jgi:hypothetical protein
MIGAAPVPLIWTGYCLVVGLVVVGEAFRLSRPNRGAGGPARGQSWLPLSLLTGACQIT